ncbi:hypothetical protein GALL_439380 [mine drainage metagenome]|uniref:Uncharacterized protein n=1 Tax=mine drainage metagenome TaxID=410659 RepID=A0A1J5QEL0_9ZZZZ
MVGAPRVMTEMNSTLKLTANARLPQTAISPLAKPSRGISTICTGGHHRLALTSANAKVLATLANTSSISFTRVGAGLSAKHTVSAPLPNAMAGPRPAIA